MVDVVELICLSDKLESGGPQFPLVKRRNGRMVNVEECILLQMRIRIILRNRSIRDKLRRKLFADRRSSNTSESVIRLKSWR